MRCSGALVLVAAFASLAGCVAPDVEPGTRRPFDTGPGGSPAGFKGKWSRSFGYALEPGSGQRARDVAVSADGKLVVVAMEFDAGIEGVGLPQSPHVTQGGKDLLIAAYNGEGKALWAKRWGDYSEQKAPTVAIDKGNHVLVAGYLEGTIDFGDDITVTSAGESDAFVVKLDAQGKALWAHTYGDTSTQFATDVAVDAAGDVLLVGYASGEIDFGEGIVAKTTNEDIFIAKLRAAKGAHVWSKRIGKAGSYGTDDPTAHVAVTSDGQVVIAGYAEDALKIPELEMVDRGDRTAFVAKLDSSSGDGKWGRTFGAPGASQHLFGLSVSGSGAVAIAGEMRGTVAFGGKKFTSGEDSDVFVAVFEGGGTPVWSRGFGSNGPQTAWDVAFNAKDELFVVGDFSGALDLMGNDVLNHDVKDTGSDAFVVQFDPSGEPLRASGYGMSNWQYARAIAVDQSNNAFVVGYYNESMDFGDEKPLTSSGGEDAYLVKLSP